jgi:hypothetical protein
MPGGTPIANVIAIRGVMPKPEFSAAAPADGRPAKGASSLSRKADIFAMAIWLATSVAAVGCLSIGRFWPSFGLWGNAIWISAALAPLVLTVASALVLRRPKFAYPLGVLGAFLAWPFFLQNEFHDYRTVNSWLMLNSPGDKEPFLLFGELSILSVLLLLPATFHSVLYLASTRRRAGRLALFERIWPAFGISFVIAVVWYGTAVGWYKSPSPGGVPAELVVVRVVKRGLHFDEITTAFFRDGKVYVVHKDRCLFQYKYEVVTSIGFFSYRTLQGILERLEPPSAHRSVQVRDERHSSLRAWDSERWYVHIPERPESNLVDVEESALPKEITTLFEEARNGAKSEIRRDTMRDVCLGFCSATR